MIVDARERLWVDDYVLGFVRVDVVLDRVALFALRRSASN